MKSEICVASYTGNWSKAVDPLVGVVREFEESTGLVNTYCITFGFEEGCEAHAFLHSSYTDRPYIAAKVHKGGEVKNFELHGPSSRCSFTVRDCAVISGVLRFTGTPEEVSEKLGVGDILDIRPHEYGYLKLKYGITKEELFIPTIVKEHLNYVR